MFDKSMLADSVRVVRTFPLHKDEHGNPAVFDLKLKIETGEEADELDQSRPLAKAKTGNELNRRRLALLLAEPPASCKDFPLTSGEFQERYRKDIEEAGVIAGTETKDIAASMGVTIAEEPLYERAVAYFKDANLAHVVAEILIDYNAQLKPTELLFRV